VLHWQPCGPCTRVRHVRREGPPPLDWIGLNYYSPVVLDWRCQVVAYPWEKLSDLKQAIYPAGFYNVRPPHPPWNECSSACNCPAPLCYAPYSS
jgi:hypothetical protein